MDQRRHHLWRELIRQDAGWFAYQLGIRMRKQLAAAINYKAKAGRCGVDCRNDLAHSVEKHRSRDRASRFAIPEQRCCEGHHCLASIRVRIGFGHQQLASRHRLLVPRSAGGVKTRRSRFTGHGRLVFPTRGHDSESTRLLKLSHHRLRITLPQRLNSSLNHGRTRCNPFIDRKRMAAGNSRQVLLYSLQTAATDDVIGRSPRKSQCHRHNGSAGHQHAYTKA